MIATRLPLIVYFGTVRRPEFYVDLVGSDVGLGLLLDSETSDDLVPTEFAVVERLPFSRGAAAVAERLQRMSEEYEVESVINIEETLVRLWAEVCDRLGRPTIGNDAALAAREKDVMRERFAAKIGAGASARSERVRSESEALSAAAKIGYPVIAKPGNLWSSHFVFRCEDSSSLSAAYRDLARDIPSYLDREGLTGLETKILVEEYLAGSVHSIDCAALEDRVWTTPVIDVVTGQDVGPLDFVDWAFTTVTQLTDDEQRIMRRLAVDAVRALGTTPGVSHVEFVNTEAGPKLLEAAARPGSYRTFLLREAFGINLLQAYRDVLRGRAPDLEPQHRRAAASVASFPSVSGTLVGFNGLDRLYPLASLQRILHHKKIGERVESRRHGGGYVLTVELGHDDPAQLSADYAAARAISTELLVVDPGGSRGSTRMKACGAPP